MWVDEKGKYVNVAYCRALEQRVRRAMPEQDGGGVEDQLVRRFGRCGTHRHWQCTCERVHMCMLAWLAVGAAWTLMLDSPRRLWVGTALACMLLTLVGAFSTP